jgi:hypothetical protein
MKVDFIKLTTENHVGIWRSDDQTMKLQALARAMVDPLLPFIRKQQTPNGDCEPTTTIHQEAASSKWNPLLPFIRRQ